MVQELRIANFKSFGDEKVFKLATARRLDAVRTKPDVTICVVARALEAWPLANPEAIENAKGQTCDVGQAQKESLRSFLVQTKLH